MTSGEITVKQDGAEWIIEMNNDIAWCEFTGEIPALTGSAGPSYTKLTDFLSFTDYNQYGVNLAGVELATSGVSYVFDWSTFQTTYYGEGNYLKFELYSADGTIAPGTYTACSEGGVVGEGEFGIGYEGQFGPSGTCWYTVSGGAASYEFVTDGTLTVEVDGDNYVFILESSAVSAKYSGKLSNE